MQIEFRWFENSDAFGKANIDCHAAKCIAINDKCVAS